MLNAFHTPRIRIIVGAALCAGLSGCVLSKPISEDQASALIRSSETFRRPKYARIPRRLTIRRNWGWHYGQEPLFSVSQLATVDAAVAILRLQRSIRVDENVFGQGEAAVHVIVITPTDIDSGELLTDEDPGTSSSQQDIMDAQEERRYGYALLDRRQLQRDRGWRIAVGAREFVKVDQIHNWKDVNVQLPVNELAIDFTWRWRPNELGEPFDSRSAAFESLPDSVQEEAKTSGVRMNTADPMHSRAFLRRDGDAWKLHLIDWSFGRGNPR